MKQSVVLKVPESTLRRRISSIQNRAISRANLSKLIRLKRSLFKMGSLYGFSRIRSRALYRTRNGEFFPWKARKNPGDFGRRKMAS